MWNRGIKNKYGNVHAMCSLNHKHRSRLEASICQILQLREKANEIKILQTEETITICGPPGHPCPRKKTYIADFKCLDIKTGSEFRVEAKGRANDRWPTTKILWRHYGPSKLEIWGGTHGSPTLIETLEKGTLCDWIHSGHGGLGWDLYRPMDLLNSPR